MPGWELALVIIAAATAGALVPVSVVATLTLNDIRREVVATSRSARSLIGKTEATVDHFEKISRGLEGGEKQVGQLIRSLGELSEIVDRLKSTTRIASAVASAIVPAVTALVTSLWAPATPLRGDGESSASETAAAPSIELKECDDRQQAA